MADFNIEALSFFTQVDYDHEDTMVQKSGTGTKSAGLWNKWDITRWHRSDEEKEANNAIREQLLVSLGRAFGIEGGVTYDEDGDAVFSNRFMDELERLLGDDLKRSNFGVGKNGGKVSSGKPLTQRRITAILEKAQQVANNPGGVDVGEPGAVKPASPVKLGERVPFTVDAYLDKVNAILNSEKASGGVRGAMTEVKKALEFLKNDLPGLIKVNGAYDPEYDPDDPRCLEQYYIEVPRNKADESQKTPASKDGYGKMLFDYDRDFYRCKVTKDDVRALIAEKFGFTVHIEYVKLSEGRDIAAAIKGYVANVLSMFAKTAIDLYEDTLGTDKARGFELSLMYHDACIEGWTDGLMKFQMENNLVRVEKGDEAVDLNVADHNDKTTLENCMYKEVQIIMKGRNEESPKWSECRPVLVDRLVGKKRPLEVGGGAKVITEADIDNLKNAFMDVLMGEE